jgi:hypothetical protein
MKKIFWIPLLLIVPGITLAAENDSRIAETYQCDLKDGKTMEEVQAVNVRWLANARKQAGTDGVNSYAFEPIVGDQTKFVFIDSYPDLAAWAAAKSADQTEEGKAIEAAFGDLMECEKNRLWKSTKH